MDLNNIISRKLVLYITIKERERTKFREGISNVNYGT